MCWNRLVAMTRDCKSLGFGLRRFESYFQHQNSNWKAPSRRFFVFARSIIALHTKKTPIWRLSTSNYFGFGGRTRTVGSDAVGDEWKSKVYFRFFEATPDVVLLRGKRTDLSSIFRAKQNYSTYLQHHLHPTTLNPRTNLESWWGVFGGTHAKNRTWELVLEEPAKESTIMGETVIKWWFFRPQPGSLRQAVWSHYIT